MKRHLDQIGRGLVTNEGTEVGFWSGKVLDTRVLFIDIVQGACVGGILG